MKRQRPELGRLPFSLWLVLSVIGGCQLPTNVTSQSPSLPSNTTSKSLGSEFQPGPVYHLTSYPAPYEWVGQPVAGAIDAPGDTSGDYFFTVTQEGCPKLVFGYFYSKDHDPPYQFMWGPNQVYHTNNPDGSVTFCYDNPTPTPEPTFEPTPPPSPTGSAPVVPSSTPAPPLRERIKNFLESDLRPVTSDLDRESAKESYESAVFLEMTKISQEGYGTQEIIDEFQYVVQNVPLVMGPGSQGYLTKKTESAGRKFAKWVAFSFGSIPQAAIPTPLPYEFVRANEANPKFKRVIPIFWQLIERATDGVIEVGIGNNEYAAKAFIYGTDEKRFPIAIPDERGKPRNAITLEEAEILGTWWVGTPKNPANVNQWISVDGWKRYRHPHWKVGRKEWQANFEIARTQNNFTLVATNGHLPVKDPALVRP